jgi:signal peptide peptidase SppA
MAKASLLHIADLVVDQPLFLLPEKLGIIAEVLKGRIGLDGDIPGEAVRSLSPEAAALAAPVLFEGPQASRFEGDSLDRDEAGKVVGIMPYRRTAEGVGIITITGALINRGAWVGASSGKTSYEGIAFQLKMAAADKKTKAIVLDLESPGGQAIGAMETAALVRSVCDEKPVHAFVNGMAASAAYAIASGAKTVTSIPSGLSGSIGVVMLHADFSRALDREGITPTIIHSGAHKADGNPYQPLSGPVRADLQEECDKFYAQFLATVAAGRGKRCTVAMARATEARTFIGADGVAAGLVDEIGSFSELVGALAKSGARSRGMKGKMSMSKIYDEDDLAAAQAKGQREGDAEGYARGVKDGEARGRDAAKAEGVDEGKKAGAAEGASAERARIKAIVESDAAKGRASSALHLALNTSLSADEAAAALAGVGLDTPSAGVGSPIGARAAQTIVDTGQKSAGGSLWAKAVEKVNARIH